MRFDLDKDLDNDAFNNIKNTMSYPPKSNLCKISYANFCKLAKSTKKNDNFGQVVPPFNINLSNTSATHNYFLLLHRLLIFYFRQ